MEMSGADGNNGGEAGAEGVRGVVGLIGDEDRLTGLIIIFTMSSLSFGKVTYFWLLLVVRQHLIGSQVLTRCPPLFVVHGIQAVVESRSSREIDNIPQI